VAGQLQFAAVPLAEAQRQLGQREEAVKTLRRGESMRYSGHVYDAIIEALDALGEKPAPHPDRSAVLRVLDGFDRAVLSFHDNPAAALTLDTQPLAPTVRLGEPFLVRFTLTNVGTYPVTLGRGLMVNRPEIIVSVEGLWPKGPNQPDYLSVPLQRKSILLPGEQIVVRQNVKIGDVAQFLECQPQRTATLQFSFVFDPVTNDVGRCVSRLPQIQVKPVRITRASVDATPQGLARLAGALQNGNEWQRAEAARALIALASERYTALATPIDYSALSVDPEVLLRTALPALRDPSPLVRAMTVDTLALLPADPTILNAAAPLLSDPNFLVRMVAVDVLANKQGQEFDVVVARLAVADPDPLVKTLAMLFHQAWQEQAEAERKAKASE
jgi:hypothetical protein